MIVDDIQSSVPWNKNPAGFLFVSIQIQDIDQNTQVAQPYYNEANL
jgi:hypothetical protein